MPGVKKCNGCGVILTINNTIHTTSCLTVPKCNKCGVRIDLWGVPHLYPCDSNIVTKSNKPQIR